MTTLTSNYDYSHLSQGDLEVLFLHADLLGPKRFVKQNSRSSCNDISIFVTHSFTLTGLPGSPVSPLNPGNPCGPGGPGGPV